MLIHLNLLPARIRDEKEKEHRLERWGGIILVSGILAWIVGGVANAHGHDLNGWADWMIGYGVLSMPGCTFFTNYVSDRAANLH